MGKVHGSLARAGKVKSATPKVSSSCSSLDEVLISAFLLGRVHRRHRRGGILGDKFSQRFDMQKRQRGHMRRRYDEPMVFQGDIS
jgi:hypothetical protein